MKNYFTIIAIILAIWVIGNLMYSKSHQSNLNYVNTKLKVNSDQQKYEELHDKYRTLWYRTDKKCFYDSSRKYGLLYTASLGMPDQSILILDTVPFNGNLDCK